MRDPDEAAAEQEANAHLIAAAPEMLEELKRRRDAYLFVDGGGHIGVSSEISPEDFDRLCAIIKRAEGRS